MVNHMFIFRGGSSGTAVYNIYFRAAMNNQGAPPLHLHLRGRLGCKGAAAGSRPRPPCRQERYGPSEGRKSEEQEALVVGLVGILCK